LVLSVLGVYGLCRYRKGSRNHSARYINGISVPNYTKVPTKKTTRINVTSTPR